MIEDALREAAAKGLTHLSVHPVPSADGKQVYWRATASPSTNHFPAVGNGTDIVEAVTQALKALPGAKRRTATKRFDGANPPLSEMPQRAVTAAVTDDTKDEWDRFR